MPRAARSLRPDTAGTRAADTVTTDRGSSAGSGKPFAFDRSRRLTEQAAYSRVFAKARRSRDHCFTVLYRENGSRQPRLGLAVSKKNCKLAVARNRLKRIIRESFRTHQRVLAGLDIVVINNRGAGEQANAALFESLAAHWQRCQRAATSGQERD